MKKGKYANNKRSRRGATSKTLMLMLSLALIVGCVAGGTLAWLLDESQEVTNTFTNSEIGVGLEETKNDDDYQFQMIPGWTLEKNPQAWVDANSVDCYLFVKVTEDKGVVTYKGADGNDVTTKWTDFLTYAIADGWTMLTENGGYGKGTTVYYKEFKAGSKDAKGTKYSILDGDKITVNDTVTKEMMDALKATPAQYPTLSFTAYASQMYKDSTTPFTAAQAWANVSGN